MPQTKNSTKAAKIAQATKERMQMQREMYGAMRELMGGDYIPAYYEQLAGDFIAVAEAYKKGDFK